MKKYLALTLCLLTGALSAWSQSGMTDEQVVSYVIEQNDKGVPRPQIVNQLMKQGVTTDQMRRLKHKYQDKIDSGQMTMAELRASVRSSAPRTRVSNAGVSENASLDQIAESESAQLESDIDYITTDHTGGNYISGRRIFGHDVFNNKNLTFESSMNLATPQNYVLGPGDEVHVDVWGASQESISQTISPDGTITIDGIGVIQLSGLSVTQAKAKLKREIGPRYQGSKINLTLGQTRTITISVMGEVKVPGTYTLSAFSSVFNALYMAGGPNEIGTLRAVKVYRKGRLLSNVDVYDFLLNGKLSGDVRLQDNDIITVSPYEALVSISGKVKRPMFYEMKRGETVATLLSYAGGFTGDAHTRALRVNRKTEPQLSVFNVGEFDYSNFKLMDEDAVTVDSTLNRYQNMVEVRGAVFRPGMYQVGGDINSVKTLIEAAAGLKEAAISRHAVLHRMKADRTREAMSIDLYSIIEGSIPDIPLQNEDVLFIGSREELNNQKTVTIHGEVADPGMYDYVENETIEDLILQAGGPTEAASLSKIDVARRISNPHATFAGDSITQVFSFRLNPDFTLDDQTNFTLLPFDEVYVRRSPDYNIQQNVHIEGEIQFAGNYALTNKSQRLSDIIRRAGGLTGQAYVKGTKLLRRMTAEERAVMETVLRTAARNSGKDSIDISKLMDFANYPVGIELDKALKNPGTDDDPILREGDRIIVPHFTSTVSINGEVLYPNTVRFKHGKKAKYYIEQAGGYTSSAKKGKTIIIYMNGMVAKASSSKRPEPGCQIVVPTKQKGKGLSLSEILAIGTTTASLGTMAATILNLTKK